MNWSYRLEFSLMALGITIPLTFNITQASSNDMSCTAAGAATPAFWAFFGAL
jgi:hypothetical protein